MKIYTILLSINLSRWPFLPYVRIQGASYYIITFFPYPYTTGASSTHHPPPPPSSSVSSSPSSPTTRPWTSPRRAAGWSGYRQPVLAVGYRAGTSNVQYGLFEDQQGPYQNFQPAHNLPGPTLKHKRKFSFHPQSYGFTYRYQKRSVQRAPLQLLKLTKPSFFAFFVK
jgi:hypothetical protein